MIFWFKMNDWTSMLQSSLDDHVNVVTSLFHKPHFQFEQFSVEREPFYWIDANPLVSLTLDFHEFQIVSASHNLYIGLYKHISQNPHWVLKYISHQLFPSLCSILTPSSISFWTRFEKEACSNFWPLSSQDSSMTVRSVFRLFSFISKLSLSL